MKGRPDSVKANSGQSTLDCLRLLDQSGTVAGERCLYAGSLTRGYSEQRSPIAAAILAPREPGSGIWVLNSDFDSHRRSQNPEC